MHDSGLNFFATKIQKNCCRLQLNSAVQKNTFFFGPKIVFFPKKLKFFLVAEYSKFAKKCMPKSIFSPERVRVFPSKLQSSFWEKYFFSPETPSVWKKHLLFLFGVFQANWLGKVSESQPGVVFVIQLLFSTFQWQLFNTSHLLQSKFNRLSRSFRIRRKGVAGGHSSSSRREHDPSEEQLDDYPRGSMSSLKCNARERSGSMPCSAAVAAAAGTAMGGHGHGDPNIASKTWDGPSWEIPTTFLPSPILEVNSPDFVANTPFGYL